MLMYQLNHTKTFEQINLGPELSLQVYVHSRGNMSKQYAEFPKGSTETTHEALPSKQMLNT